MIRFTPEEFQRLQDKVNRRVVVPPAKKTRRNKYGAQAVEVDGVRFDSKAEARRYLQLKALQQAGEISGLEIQVPFDLVPALDVGGRKERPVRYVADFRYTKGGTVVVEDTKSAPTKTKFFIGRPVKSVGRTRTDRPSGRQELSIYLLTVQASG